MTEKYIYPVMSNDNEATDLLPCPFCGGKADSRCTAGPDPDWFVECTECLASVPVFSGDKLDGWNTRVQPTELQQGEPGPSASAKPRAPGADLANVFTGFRVVKVCDIPDDMMMVGEKLFRLLSASTALERKP